MARPLAIGIDLGTTKCSIAVWRDDHVEIIPQEDGELSMPCVVAFRDGITEMMSLIGSGAKHQLVSNARGVIFDAQRMIGRGFTDVFVQTHKPLWPFQVVAEPNDELSVLVEYKQKQKCYKIADIISMFLKKLRDIAQRHLQTSVEHAVITVPSCFNSLQRKLVEDCASLAGFKKTRLINSTAASALAYAFHCDSISTDIDNILVFDFGGGTLEVSLLDKCESSLIVMSTTCDPCFGGADIDVLLMKYFLEQLKAQHINCKDDPKARWRLRKAAETLKELLTETNEASVHMELFYDNTDCNITLTRSKFQWLINTVLYKLLGPINKCLEEANIQKSRIHRVILVGGSTRIPIVQKTLIDFFGKDMIFRAINPDEASVIGAAIQAGILVGESKLSSFLLQEATSHSLGVGMAITNTFGIGDETFVPGSMYFVVFKNSGVPCEKGEIVAAFNENQRVVSIEIYEGEKMLARDNILVGKMELRLPENLGRIFIVVTIRVSCDGVKTVIAEEKRSGLREEISLPNIGGVSKADVKRIGYAFFELDEEALEEVVFQPVYGRSTVQGPHPSEATVQTGLP